MARWVTIPKWLELHYDPEDRPTVRTVREWCREGKIYPAPRRHGRAYYLDSRAVYVDPTSRASVSEAKRLVHGTEAA